MAQWWQAVTTAVVVQRAISDCFSKLRKVNFEEATINRGQWRQNRQAAMGVEAALALVKQHSVWSLT